MNMIKRLYIAVFSMIAMSCTGCRWLGLDFNFDGAILIYNDSASGIYCLCPSYDDIRPDCVSCTYPDTTICFTIRPGIGLDGGSGWYYIPAKETTTAGRPNSHMERWFSAFPQDTMSIFIFDEETVNHNSWKIIAEEYLVLQRYDLSIEDIKKLNYNIYYPPTPEMQDMHMYPQYGQSANE